MTTAAAAFKTERPPFRILGRAVCRGTRYTPTESVARRCATAARGPSPTGAAQHRGQGGLMYEARRLKSGTLCPDRVRDGSVRPPSR